MSDFITETGKLLGNLGGTIVNWLPSTKDVQTVVVKEVKTMTVIPASIFVRLAGLSGAIAVGIGAYGAHGKLQLVYHYYIMLRRFDRSPMPSQY